MNHILAIFVRTFIVIPSTFIVWLVSFFGFDQTFLLSSVIATVSGALTYISIKTITDARFLKRQGLTRKEYKYIKQNLSEAKRKMDRLQKVLFSIRSIGSMKQNYEIYRITRQIYSLTKKEPKRFYKAEKFYFYHLDSIVELMEKYSFLTTQPKKTMDLEFSLKETRQTIKELNETIQHDLQEVLIDDLETMNMEVDVAKRFLKK